MITKIGYLSGPADGPDIYQRWVTGTDDFFGTNYMREFLQFAHDLDARAHILTWHGDSRYEVERGAFTFDNRPLKKGVHFFIGQVIWHLQTLVRLLRFRPDLLVLTGNEKFWWMLSPLRLFGTRFLPSYHGALWPKLGRRKLTWRILLFLEKWLVLRSCPIIVVTSHDIGRQVAALCDARIIYHLPTWSRGQFDPVDPVPQSSPLRVMFAARLTQDKGTWDVLEMARRLPDVEFSICGIGPELAGAEAAAPGNVTFYGFCDRTEMFEVMGQSHLCIVPTRTDCEAGFEMTCAEAILGGRPLVTSPVCPALEYMEDAAVVAKPDDAASYVEAITALRDDPKLFETKRAATADAAEQFYDQSQSWGVAMRKAVAALP